MKRSVRVFLLLVLLLLLSLAAPAAVIDVEPQRGRAVAQLDWTDETNRTHNLSEFAGYPVIVLPIFTRCQTACIQSVARLKSALASSSADPRQFRVLLFSFDATDSPAVLAKYRERDAIPLSWSVGSSTQPNIDAFLDSLGFRVGKAGTQFTHPNMLLFLDRDLRTAHWIYGTDFSARDVDSALGLASGNSSWLAENSEWLYAVLLFFGSILCVVLCSCLIQLRARRRAGGVQPVLAR